MCRRVPPLVRMTSCLQPGARTLPKTLGEFDVNFGSPLGNGACATVFPALRRDTNQEVAIKIMSQAVHEELNLSLGDPIAQETEAFEQVIQKGLGHPHVVELQGYFEDSAQEAMRLGMSLPDAAVDEPVHCFVMEKVDGDSLVERIKSGCLGEEKVKTIARSMCEGLAYLHEQGIAHRDVKPSNVLFEGKGEAKQLKLIDFSHASVLPEDAEPDDAFMDKRLGTPGFIAPEVLVGGGPYTMKCDVYSLGCVVHAMLASGRLPRYSRGMTFSFLPEEVTPEARSLVDSMLCAEPSLRPSAAEVLAEPWLHLSE